MGFWSDMFPSKEDKEVMRKRKEEKAKKLKERQRAEEIAIEDKNKKRNAARDRLYDIFKEVTGDHETKIINFMESYNEPEENITEFAERQNITVVSDSHTIEVYNRAKYFKEMLEKYKNIVTYEGCTKFRRIMQEEYQIEITLDDIGEGYFVDLPTTETMLKICSEISLEDAPLLRAWYNGGWEDTPNVSENYMEYLKHKIPDNLTFGEKFKLNHDDLPVKDEHGNFKNGEFAGMNRMHRFGMFSVLHEKVDPIILAKLKDSIYIVVAHMHKRPEVSYINI